MENTFTAFTKFESFGQVLGSLLWVVSHYEMATFMRS